MWLHETCLCFDVKNSLLKFVKIFLDIHLSNMVLQVWEHILILLSWKKNIVDAPIFDKNFPENELYFNPLNAELNPICHLLALSGARHVLHVSGLRVNVTCIEIMKYKMFIPHFFNQPLHDACKTLLSTTTHKHMLIVCVCAHAGVCN
jgi:hypothetical protein